MIKTPLELQQKRYAGRRRGLAKLLGIIFSITLAIIFLALWADRHSMRTVIKVPAALPHNANRRSSGETFTRSEDGREIFSIHASQTLSFGNGTSMELEGVHVVIFGRDGKQHDEISTERCRYNRVTNALACFGRASVKLASLKDMSARRGIEVRQPLFLETSDVSYDPANSTIVTTQPAQFTYGLASGHSAGLSYNVRTGGLTLASDVSARLPGVLISATAAKANRQATGAAPIDLSAGGLVYDRTANTITLNPPVRFTQGGKSLAGATGSIFLDAQHRARRITLTGARGSDVLANGALNGMAENVAADLDPASNQILKLSAAGDVFLEARQESPARQSLNRGSLRRLTAQTVTLDFTQPQSGHSSQPKSGEARGPVMLVFQPAQSGNLARHAGTGRADAGERILSAPGLIFSFRPSGAVEDLRTEGRGELESIPTDACDDHLTATAGNLRMAFDTAGRLETVHGSASARVVDEPPPLPSAKGAALAAGAPRVSTSEQFLAKFDPASGVVSSIEQEGHVHFQQGTDEARADRAVYLADGPQLDLLGHAEAWNPDGRTRAKRMQLNFGTGIANAWGSVQSIYYGDSNLPVQARSASDHPASDDAVVVLADQMVADKLHQHARYEGHVRVLRAADVIETPSLDVYKNGQRLVSGRGVVTSLTEPARVIPASSNATERRSGTGAVQPVTIRANRLVYFNVGREAVYEGNVVMVSADTIFRSSRLKIYFSPPKGVGNSEVARAVAEGHVTVTQGTGRRASGDHAEYFADNGKIVLTGGPPVVYDAQQGSITGQRLTFFIRDASLFADGGKTSRTLSKHVIPRQ